MDMRNNKRRIVLTIARVNFSQSETSSLLLARGGGGGRVNRKDPRREIFSFELIAFCGDIRAGHNREWDETVDYENETKRCFLPKNGVDLWVYAMRQIFFLTEIWFSNYFQFFLNWSTPVDMIKAYRFNYRQLARISNRLWLAATCKCKAASISCVIFAPSFSLGDVSTGRRFN